MSGLNVWNNGSQTQSKKSPLGTALSPLVYFSDSPTGPWTLATFAIFERAVVFSGSEGVDRLEFLVPYGSTLSPLEGGSFLSVSPNDLSDAWVKLDMVDAAGAKNTVFVGQVRGQDCDVFGSDSDVAGQTAPVPKGFQRWAALGGLQILRMTSISKSFSLNPSGSAVVRLDWSPGFNARDSKGLFRGNRSDSAAPDDPSFVFGGTSTWTRRQALDYVLKRFLNTGPIKWTLGGQLEVLAEDLRLLEIGLVTNAAELLRRIIAHKEGIEFGVHPSIGTDGNFSGFEIKIFTLTAAPVTFLSCTIPANPNVVSFSTSDMEDVDQLRVSTDRSTTASRIRLVGERVVVCATLLGPTLSGDAGGDVLTSTVSTLIGKWTSALEAAYKAGDPTATFNSDHAKHDRFRAQTLFESVYLRYGLPQGFARPPAWVPAFDGNMNQVGAALYQDAIRETLSWIPLLEGYDYSTNPATNNNPTGAFPEVRRPYVIAEDHKAEDEDETAPTMGPTTSAPPTQWSPIDKMGFGYSALQHDLGVQIHASPNHRLAFSRGTFDGTSEAISEFFLDSDKDGPLDEGHAADARTLAATIAWKTDTRFVLEYALDSENDDGTVVEVEAHDAQFWWLAPGTIVGLDSSGKPVTSGATGIALRNDADLFAPMMAGLIARYVFARTRVDFAFHGWRPWLQLLGAVLTTVDEGGNKTPVNSPITCVELVGGLNAEPRTVVRAGFAK